MKPPFAVWLLSALILTALTAGPALAQADSMQAMPGMNMPTMEMPSTGILGAYPMSRDASGTSWQPDAAEHGGVHEMAGDWMLMGHLMLTGVYDMQSGPRGDDKTFLEGMV